MPARRGPLAPGWPRAHEFDAGTNARDGLVGFVTTQHTRPALTEVFLLRIELAQRRDELRTPGCCTRGFLGVSRHQFRAQARRLGLEGRDDVDIGSRIERGDHGTAPLAEHTFEPAGPLHQPLHAAEGVGQILFAAGRQLGRRRRRLGVELFQRLVELAFLVAADFKALGGDTAAGNQVRQLRAGQVAAHRQQLRGNDVVRAGGGSLALEGADLAAHLAYEITQALEVLRGGGEAPLGTLAASTVLEHPGRLFDDGSAVLGTGVEHGVQLPLADDHVLLAADPRITQKLLDVEQPTGRPVDRVLAVTRTEQRSRDGHLGEVDRQLPGCVVDGERHLGPAERRPRRRAGEDDVFHFRRAERTGTLGAEHPGHRVDDVGLAAPIGPDHDGDAGFEFQHGRVRKGLETLHAERLQEHRSDPTGCLTRLRGNAAAVAQVVPTGRDGAAGADPEAGKQGCSLSPYTHGPPVLGVRVYGQRGRLAPRV